MAKEQSLSLNPTKISGLCSRLMCCLKYEEEVYKEKNKRLPRVGQAIMTPDGEGKVMNVQTLTEIVSVKVNTEDNVLIKNYFFEHLEEVK